MKPRKNFRSRPKKSGARRTARVNAQKKKLIEAGYDPEILDKMNIVEIRELLKGSQRKSTKMTQTAMKIQADASKRSAGARKKRKSKKRAGKKKPGKKIK